MENGWIKLHRKLIKKGYYKRSSYVHLWVHLLLSANHRKSEFLWNGKTIIITEGQLLVGRRKLRIETGISETTIERILNYLESEHQIGQQKTSKFRIITILKWHEYQNRTLKRTTDGQQTDTYKKVKKNKKNIPSTKSKDSSPPMRQHDEQDFEDQYEPKVELGASRMDIETWRKLTKKEPVGEKKRAMDNQRMFQEMIFRSIRVRPLWSSAGYFNLLKVQKTLSDKQIRSLFEDWIASGKADEDLIQITQATSTNYVNRWMVRNQ